MSLKIFDSNNNYLLTIFIFSCIIFRTTKPNFNKNILLKNSSRGKFLQKNNSTKFGWKLYQKAIVSDIQIWYFRNLIHQTEIKKSYKIHKLINRNWNYWFQFSYTLLTKIAQNIFVPFKFMNIKTKHTFRIFPGWWWSASLLLQLALFFVPDLPAAHLFLAHATIKLLLLVVVQFFQQLGVHPQVLQDLLQHFDDISTVRLQHKSGN